MKIKKFEKKLFYFSDRIFELFAGSIVHKLAFSNFFAWFDSPDLHNEPLELSDRLMKLPIYLLKSRNSLPDRAAHLLRRTDQPRQLKASFACPIVEFFHMLYARVCRSID